jgi:hypothetical protein
MSKKGETGEQDRGKPQPQKKKDRDAKRKDKKAARIESQIKYPVMGFVLSSVTYWN